MEQPRNELAERLDEIRDANTGENWEHLSEDQVDALREAAEALRAADRLSEAVSKFSILSGMFDPEKSRAAYANDFYRSARGQ